MSDEMFAYLVSLEITRALLVIALVSVLCEVISKLSSRYNSLSVAESTSLEEDLFYFIAISSSTYNTDI